MLEGKQRFVLIAPISSLSIDSRGYRTDLHSNFTVKQKVIRGYCVKQISLSEIFGALGAAIV